MQFECLILGRSDKQREYQTDRGGARNFCLGGPSATLIHLLRQLPHTYIYTYARFFIIYTYFLFDKLYIYIQKKRSLVFSSKIIFDGDLS